MGVQKTALHDWTGGLLISTMHTPGPFPDDQPLLVARASWLYVRVRRQRIAKAQEAVQRWHTCSAEDFELLRGLTVSSKAVCTGTGGRGCSGCRHRPAVNNVPLAICQQDKGAAASRSELPHLCCWAPGHW